MKQRLTVSLLVLSAFVLSLGLACAAHAQEDVTVQGEIVDMACYMVHEGKGSKHADCGKMCVQGGAPLGILTSDGAVYLLVENHSSAKAKKPFSQAKKLVAETVTIKGDMYQRGGVQAIVVESVAKE